MEPQSIRAVQPGPDRVLLVTWKNGAESPVDVAGHIDRFAIFAPLHEEAMSFGSVSVGENGWSAHWSDDMEISADTLWRLALEQGAGWFRAWRKERGLTQEGAAKALGLSLRMVRYYEAGTHLLSKTVRLACAGLDLERAA
ncbi:DUF2442 domain-containing protein [Methylobacterium iners]|uniref:HTH cro/C1-type domain-containing protein n=1 Tax=Methylobacterium iners TaxID=418707 RepID=A0ABQ4RY09_9HYPH|nr:helix-turn-helix domain-containing protein [Methylobacterium iners]GJD95531.1 hypothetical protein OCOJLMKI_2744 [Methylobacterium iners]